MNKSSNWKKSLKEAIRDLDDLLEILEIDPSDLWINPDKDSFPILVPKSYLERIKKGDPNDPLLLQIIPTSHENEVYPQFSNDPLKEISLSNNGLIKKYSSRELLITTQSCPIHCRYCFRKNYPYEENHFVERKLLELINDLRSRNETKEIILSGGVPLSLSNRKINNLIRNLETINHLTTLRIHTRFPIIIPERIDHELIQILKSTRLNTIIVTHSNHANEIDHAVHSMLLSMKNAGITLLNQSVLLKNINDNIDSLKNLSYKLFNAGVLPYYIHQIDRVTGSAHFMVDDKIAINLIHGLRQEISGYLVPQLVREVPGELSKIPIT